MLGKILMYLECLLFPQKWQKQYVEFPNTTDTSKPNSFYGIIGQATLRPTAAQA